MIKNFNEFINSNKVNESISFLSKDKIAELKIGLNNFKNAVVQSLEKGKDPMGIVESKMEEFIVSIGKDLSENPKTKHMMDKDNVIKTMTNVSDELFNVVFSQKSVSQEIENIQKTNESINEASGLKTISAVLLGATGLISRILNKLSWWGVVVTGIGKYIVPMFKEYSNNQGTKDVLNSYFDFSNATFGYSIVILLSTFVIYTIACAILKKHKNK